jgi:hypothetical protein
VLYGTFLGLVLVYEFFSQLKNNSVLPFYQYDNLNAFVFGCDYCGSRDPSEFGTGYEVPINDPTQDIVWDQMGGAHQTVIDEPTDSMPPT